MTQTPAGWYPDPDPAAAPGRLRYWDGVAWTDHVQDPAPAPAPAPAYPSYPTYPPSPGYPTYAAGGVATTPDGAPLAGWWQRVLAAILDGLLQLVLIAAVAVPVVASNWDQIEAWADRHTVDGTFTYDSRFDDLPAVFDITTSTGLLFFGSGFLVSIVYQIVFLRWKQATPGKLAVGLRIRLRERPELPWATILVRVGFVIGLGILGQAPVLGIFAGIASLLDVLWPLWDKDKQALHDKVARTNVVRVR